MTGQTHTPTIRLSLAEADSLHRYGLARLPTYWGHAHVGKIDGNAIPDLMQHAPGPGPKALRLQRRCMGASGRIGIRSLTLVDRTQPSGRKPINQRQFHVRQRHGRRLARR